MTCGCRKSGDAAGRGSEHRQACRRGNCCCCRQLQALKNCELGLGILGFGVCESTAAAANGSALFWEGQLRFGCTLAPGEGLGSTCYRTPLPLQIIWLDLLAFSLKQHCDDPVFSPEWRKMLPSVLLFLCPPSGGSLQLFWTRWNGSCGPILTYRQGFCCLVRGARPCLCPWCADWGPQRCLAREGSC